MVGGGRLRACKWHVDTPQRVDNMPKHNRSIATSYLTIIIHLINFFVSDWLKSHATENSSQPAFVDQISKNFAIYEK